MFYLLFYNNLLIKSQSMLDPTVWFDDERILDYTQTTNRFYAQKDNELEPWEMQRSKIRSHEHAKKKQTKIQKLPDVEKFLSTVKNIRNSPTQKNRKKSNHHKQGFHINNIIQFSKSKQFEMDDHTIHHNKKEDLNFNKNVISIQYKNQSKKLQAIKRFSNFPRDENQSKNISKNNITLNPFFQKPLTYEQNVEQQHKRFKSNLQKLLKLKQKIRRKKISITLNQVIKNPIIRQDSNSSRKIQQNNKKLNVNIGQHPNQKYSYFSFNEYQYFENKPKKQTMKNFFLINHKFQKWKLKQKDEKSHRQKLNFKKQLNNAGNHVDQNTLTLFNTMYNSVRPKLHSKNNQNIYIK